jgi:hypothetical protein
MKMLHALAIAIALLLATAATATDRSYVLETPGVT